MVFSASCGPSLCVFAAKKFETQLIQAYSQRKKLGDGDSGVVYEVTTPDGKFALKVPHSTAKSGLRAEFDNAKRLPPHDNLIGYRTLLEERDGSTLPMTPAHHHRSSSWHSSSSSSPSSSSPSSSSVLAAAAAAIVFEGMDVDGPFVPPQQHTSPRGVSTSATATTGTTTAHNGAVAVLLELAEGGSLAQHIPDETALSEDFVRRIARDVLMGLRHIHECGFMHLDIKPANIFLSAEAVDFLRSSPSSFSSTSSTSASSTATATHTTTADTAAAAAATSSSLAVASSHRLFYCYECGCHYC